MKERLPDGTSLLYFLVGGFAGATAALLLAPQSGPATRALMTRAVSDTRDSAREMRDRVVHQGEELWKETTRRVNGAATALVGGVGPNSGDNTSQQA